MCIISGGSDYSIGIYAITIPAEQTSVMFDIPILDDTTIEGDEDFNLKITPRSLPHRVTLINLTRTTVTIMNDDGKSHQNYIIIVAYSSS